MINNLRVTQFDGVDEVIHKWPRLVVLAREEELTLSQEELLQMYLTCIESGAVFGVYGDRGLQGVCCVVQDGFCARIITIPSSNGGSIPMDIACIEAVEKWCNESGLDSIKATTRKLNGSSLAYFGHRLGFRRESVTFIKDL